jgi:hypothetical protein
MMRTTAGLYFLLLAFLHLSTTAAAGSNALRPEVLETFFRLRVVAAALDIEKVSGPYPGPTAGLVPLASVLDRPFIVQRRLRGSLRDAWGRPILYWSDGTSYMVVSLGADGQTQFDYSLDPPYAGVPKGWAGTDPTDDLVVVDGVAYRGPASLSEILRRAMADLRITATACESYAIDNNVYPGPVTPIDAVSRIETDLEPVYIRVLTKVDPWGQPYLFWSNTRAYALVSYGVDGQPDYPYLTWGQAEFEALATGPTTRLGQDLVFVNGQFAQWPAVGVGP